jgi:hypothetical protein
MDVLVNVNWWAVAASMVVTMAIGSVWYSQLLFGGIWQQELKIKAKEMGGADPTAAMIGAALLTLIQATILAILIGSGDVMEGVRMGALTSVGLVSAAIGVQYCFEGRSLRLFLVNAGYMVVGAIGMGAIIGAWH